MMVYEEYKLYKQLSVLIFHYLSLLVPSSHGPRIPVAATAARAAGAGAATRTRASAIDTAKPVPGDLWREVSRNYDLP